MSAVSLNASELPAIDDAPLTTTPEPLTTTPEPLTDEEIVPALTHDELIANLAKLIVPATEDEAERLDDGSLLLFTLRREEFEDYSRDDNGEVVDTLQFVVKANKNIQTYVAARDLPAGTTIFTEAPLSYVGIFDSSVQYRRARELLPPGKFVTVENLLDGYDVTIEKNSLDGESVKHIDGPCKGLPPKLEWLLTYAFIADNSIKKHKRIIDRMPQAGMHSLCKDYLRAFKSKKTSQQQDEVLDVKLIEESKDAEITDDDEITEDPYPQEARAIPEDIRVWMSHICRTRPGLSVPDVIAIYEVILHNCLHMRSPLTDIDYGIGLYPGIAHFARACLPNAEVIFGESGYARLVTTENVVKGTEITINTGIRMIESIRCLQMAPAWIRSSWDASHGHRCACAECLQTLRWLRDSAQGNPGHKVTTEEAPAIVDMAKVKKIMAIIAGTWESDPNITYEGIPDHCMEFLTNYPLLLPNTGEHVQVLLQIAPAVLRAGFTGAPCLHYYSLARSLCKGTVQDPVALQSYFGAEIIRLAGEYYMNAGQYFVIACLKDQGASKEIIRRRLADHDAVASFSAFAARVAYPLVYVQRTSDIDELTKRAREALPDDTEELLQEAWVRGIIAAQHPDLEQEALSEQATMTLARKFKVEALLAESTGLGIAALRVQKD